jgi:hypothetical protein
MLLFKSHKYFTVSGWDVFVLKCMKHTGRSICMGELGINALQPGQLSMLSSVSCILYVA